MKPTVISIGVANVAVLALMVWIYLWVLDVTFSGGGVTHWQDPARVAVLTVIAAGAAVVAGVSGTQLFRSPHRPRRLLASYLASSVILTVAGLIVVFGAVVTQ